MVRADLVEYIKKTMSLGYTQEKITSALKSKGFSEEVIQEAFLSQDKDTIFVNKVDAKMQSIVKVLSIVGIVLIVFVVAMLMIWFFNSSTGVAETTLNVTLEDCAKLDATGQCYGTIAVFEEDISICEQASTTARTQFCFGYYENKVHEQNNCDSSLGDELYVSCLMGYVVADGSIAACSNLKNIQSYGNGIVDYCVRIQVSSYKDSLDCSEIDLFEGLIHPGELIDYWKLCLFNIVTNQAVNEKDVSLCNDIPTEYDEPSDCKFNSYECSSTERKTDPEYRNKCVSLIALEKQDYNLCEGMSDYKDGIITLCDLSNTTGNENFARCEREECIKDIAISLEDIDKCSEVMYNRYNCYFEIAINQDNITICETYLTTLSGNCIANIYYNRAKVNNDSAYCDLINSLNTTRYGMSSEKCRKYLFPEPPAPKPSCEIGPGFICEGKYETGNLILEVKNENFPNDILNVVVEVEDCGSDSVESLPKGAKHVYKIKCERKEQFDFEVSYESMGSAVLLYYTKSGSFTLN